MLSLGLGINRPFSAQGASASIIFDAPLVIAEDATAPLTIAQASVPNGTGTYTYTITSDPSGFFVFINANLRYGAGTGDLTPGTKPITIQADNGAGDVRTLTTSVFVSSAAAVSMSSLALNSYFMEAWVPGQRSINWFHHFRNGEVQGSPSGDVTADQDADGWFERIPAGGTAIRYYYDGEDNDAGQNPARQQQRLRYNGQATLSFTNLTIDAGPTTVGDYTEYTVTPSTTGTAWIDITALPDDTDYPTEISLVRTAGDWTTRYDAGERINPDMLTDFTVGGKALYKWRPMNIMEVGRGIEDGWFIEASDFPTENAPTWTAGVPIEWVCEMAHQANVQVLHVVIPHSAKDTAVTAYVTRFVQKLKALSSTMQIRWEWGNEVWNSFLASGATYYCYNNALADWFYGNANPWGTDVSSAGPFNFTAGSRTVTCTDTSVLTAAGVADNLHPFTVDSDPYEHYKVQSVTNATEFEMHRPYQPSTNDTATTAYAGDFMRGSWHAKRASEVKVVVDAACAAESWTYFDHTIGTQTSNVDVIKEQFDAADWLANEPGNWIDIRPLFDYVSVDNYWGGQIGEDNFVDSAAFTALISTYNSDAAAGNAALQAHYEDPDGDDSIYSTATDLRTHQTYLDEIEAAISHKIHLDLYEGGQHWYAYLDSEGVTTDHDTFFTWMSTFLYGPEMGSLYAQHFEIVTSVVPGPYMQYADYSTQGRNGAWGERRYVGDNNSRVTAFYAAADADPHWLTDVAPVPSYLMPASGSAFEYTTNETAAITLTDLFKKQLDDFTVVVSGTLPPGWTNDGTTLSGRATDTSDATYSLTFTATSAGGEVAIVTRDVDITYVAAPTIPAATYETDFADATGLTLTGGAVVSGGELDCTAGSSYAQFTAAETGDMGGATAVTIMFDYYIDNGDTIPSNLAFLRGPMVFKPTSLQMYEAVGGGSDFPLNNYATFLQADGNWHRACLTYTTDGTTSMPSIYHDGSEAFEAGDRKTINDIPWETITEAGPQLDIGNTQGTAIGSLKIKRVRMWDEVLPSATINFIGAP